MPRGQSATGRSADATVSSASHTEAIFLLVLEQGDIIVARILATPGDQLGIQGDHYFVNGKKTVSVSPPGTLRPSLEIPQAPQTRVVPPGCFFMVQDNPKNSFDSQVLSWATQSDVIATRAIGLIGQAFGKEIK